MNAYRSESSGGSDDIARGLDSHLDQSLRGRLPCVMCGYDLRGISIRSVCPECGTAVRATILYTVDPQADEFQPITFPRLTSNALLLWSSAALVATLAAWWPRVADACAIATGVRPSSAWSSWVMIVAAVISGIASVGLMRPIPTTPIWKSAASLVSSAAYILLVWSMVRLHFQVDPSGLMPYLTTRTPSVERLGLNLLNGASVLVIVFGSRPNSRDFVRRSMAMRTKRVDRQTLVAMGTAVGVAMLGTVARLVAGQWSAADTGWLHWLNPIGQMLAALGWGLFSLGMLSAVKDTFRVRQVILIPPPTLSDVLEGPKAR